jgi:hypothetical protein
VVDAVRCAIEVQNGMIERNSGLPPERRIEFRVGIHLGDVVEESDCRRSSLVHGLRVGVFFFGMVSAPLSDRSMLLSSQSGFS